MVSYVDDIIAMSRLMSITVLKNRYNAYSVIVPLWHPPPPLPRQRAQWASGVRGGRFAGKETAWVRCDTPPSRNAEFRGSFAENINQKVLPAASVWACVPP
jgi:hypothetical protein